MPLPPIHFCLIALMPLHPSQMRQVKIAIPTPIRYIGVKKSGRHCGYSVLLHKWPPIHPLSFVKVTFAIGSLILLPLFAWETVAGPGLQFSPAAVMAIIYVAIFPSIVSSLCFSRGVELVGANRAGLFIHLMPVFGSLMSILFLGESFQASMPSAWR